MPDGDVNGRCVEQAAISPQSVQEIQEGSGSSPNAKVTEKQCRFSVVFWNRVDVRRIAPVVFGRQPEPVVIRARLGQRWLRKRTDEHGNVELARRSLVQPPIATTLRGHLRSSRVFGSQSGELSKPVL